MITNHTFGGADSFRKVVLGERVGCPEWVDTNITNESDNVDL